MNPQSQAILLETRRQLLGRSARGLGVAALATLLGDQFGGRRLLAATAGGPVAAGGPGSAGLLGVPGLSSLPHLAPKAKRCIYLHMVGAPPQQDLFDYKPAMADWYDKDLPESIRQGQRLPTMTSGQARFPIAPSMFKFARHGQSGTWVSELLPHTARMVDDLCVVRSMKTDAINHEPAITFMQTGSELTG